MSQNCSSKFHFIDTKCLGNTVFVLCVFLCSHTSGHQMWWVFFPHTKQFSKTISVSYNLFSSDTICLELASDPTSYSPCLITLTQLQMPITKPHVISFTSDLPAISGAPMTSSLGSTICKNSLPPREQLPPQGNPYLC